VLQDLFILFLQKFGSNFHFLLLKRIEIVFFHLFFLGSMNLSLFFNTHPLDKTSHFFFRFIHIPLLLNGQSQAIYV
jgi:hypothetical protein